jgi:YHS domain-containing protein
MLKSSIVVFCAFFIFAVQFSIPGQVWAKNPINTNWRGLAIKGYDPVAYFTLGKPQKGKSDFEYKWKGAAWRFSNAQHLNLFKSNPQKYAPRYGGY